jgi:hypothetical protein
MKKMELTGTTKTTARLRQRSARAESNRRLESIKQQRRRARREKWLQSLKSLAQVLSQSAETAN